VGTPSARATPVDLEAWTDGAIRKVKRAIAARDHAGLSTAVDMFDQALHAVGSTDDDNHVAALLNFAGALLEQYNRTGLTTALEECVRVLDEHDRLVPPAHRHRVEYLLLVGRANVRAGQRTGNVKDFDLAVRAYRNARKIAVRHHPRHGACSMELANTLLHRHTRTGSSRDIAEAIALAQAARRQVRDPSLLPGILSTLGNALSSQYRVNPAANSRDLDAAIGFHTEAVARAEATDQQRAMYLSDLGSALRAQYDATRQPEALRAAVGALREAVEATTEPEHIERPARLTNLAWALITLHEHTQNLAHINEAIRVCRLAVLLAAEDHAHHAGCLYHLAAALFRRGTFTGVQYDIDESANLASRAYRATPTGHPYQPTRLALYAAAAQALVGPAGLDAAERDVRQALQAAPAGHANVPLLQSNLALILNARYEHDRSRPAAAQAAERRLQEAADLSRVAVESTPPEHADYVGRLLNFVAAAANISKRRNDAALLTQALDCCRRAWELSLAAPDRASLARAHAHALSSCHELTADPHALQEALTKYRLAATAEAASARHRLGAAYDGAHLAAAAGQAEPALDLFTLAIDLMDQALWRGMSRRDQERTLQDCGSLPEDAAAWAITAGRPEQAVDLLERGRGLLFDRRIDDDADLAAVRLLAPALAERFEALRTAAGQVVIPDVDPAADTDLPHRPPHQTSEADELSHLALAIDHAVAEIQDLPGLHGMFRPPPLEELLVQQGADPVVVLNISTYRCDAVILNRGTVAVTALPGLDKTAVERQARFYRDRARLASGIDQTGQPTQRARTTRDEIASSLKWLWEAIAQPIMQDLGMIDDVATDAAAPHLIWCPTGQAAFLPLHAAGDHNGGQKPAETVIDRAACSYTPKLRALSAPRHTPETVGDAQGSPLIVTMPATAGERPLPGSLIEAQELLDTFPDAHHLSGPAATVRAVLAALPEHEWVHFSVHAAADQTTPLAGGLLLHDGRLTIGQLAELRLPRASFAFLSACETHHGVLSISNEGITLGSAMRIAGYPRVIATLWSVSDTSTPELVLQVYRRMVSRSQTAPHLDPEVSAEALHVAARHIRDLHQDQPDRWSPFVHIGLGSSEK